ncbi:MAG TPA: UbiA family prenyltransferase [Steroidobacteraceae bacterium]|nr:UbiA family prenyltransferase [Steroidobacteraceae bacterium]
MDTSLKPMAIIRDAVTSMRPYQWLKNGLVFVPLVAAHRLDDLTLLALAVRSFIAFSLCASAVYLLNDLRDLPNDRQHPYKRKRPIAAGRLPQAVAAGMVPVLLAVAGAVAAPLGVAPGAVLGGYFLLMVGYSLGLKDVVLLDVLILAVGYALRVVVGALAVGIAPSPWLVAFCIFFFFSLALLKRYAEINLTHAREGERAHARAYLLEDQSLLVALGVSTGNLSVLVLAVYTGSAKVEYLYRHPPVIWVTCILLLYWISHMWLVAHRGRMPDDPLRFALHDPLSWILVLLMAASAWIAV